MMKPRVSHGNEDGRMAKNRIQRRIVHEKSYYFLASSPSGAIREAVVSDNTV